MTETFPRASKSQAGYNIQQVEGFLSGAQRAYGGDTAQGAPLSAEDIRHTAFGMQRGGYSATHVDAAMERLEDAFAQRERDRELAVMGEQAWLERNRHSAQVVLNRLSREPGHRFRRVGFLTVGYRREDVDALAETLVAYFRHGHPVAVEDVRTAVFGRQRGGYSEAQVDMLLDTVVEVMLAVR